ncbi:MAG: hypothetical protein JWN15_1227 [Firmicutes bacterium]|nr:hypothetical protein [Bacillota bacterium]
MGVLEKSGKARGAQRMAELILSARTLLLSPLFLGLCAVVIAIFVAAFLWKILRAEEGFLFGYGNWVVGKWQAVKGTPACGPEILETAGTVGTAAVVGRHPAAPRHGTCEQGLHVERSVLTLSRVLDGDMAYLMVNHTDQWDTKILRILETLVSGVTRVVYVPGRCRCGFFILDEAERHLVLVAGEGYAGPRWPQLDLEHSCAGRAFLTGEEYYCRDIVSDPVYWDSARGNRDFRSIACVPVRAGRVVFGVICLDAEETDAFTQDDFVYMETFAAKLAVLCALHTLQATGAAKVPLKEGD